MAYYTILNFEDPHAPNQAGAVQGGRDWAGLGAGAAAGGTASLYKKRAKAKSKILNKKKLVFYPCQELIARDKQGQLSRNEVTDIREDCRKSKTIAIVIHGQPSETEHGFSTAGNTVCSWGDLGRLSLLLLPDRTTTYNIALIMCYGARSQNAKLDHDGMIPPGELKTSFAYKFFRRICQSRNVRMSARTGAVSTDADIAHTVEKEGEVMIAVEKQEVQTARNLNKADMDRRKQQLIDSGKCTQKEFADKVFKFANTPDLPPVGKVERFAKDYVIYSPNAFYMVKQKYDGLGNTGVSDKYGKFVYEFNGVLTITARYATAGHAANHTMYQGPLL